MVIATPMQKASASRTMGGVVQTRTMAFLAMKSVKNVESAFGIWYLAKELQLGRRDTVIALPINKASASRTMGGVVQTRTIAFSPIKFVKNVDGVKSHVVKEILQLGRRDTVTAPPIHTASTARTISIVLQTRTMTFSPMKSVKNVGVVTQVMLQRMEILTWLTSREKRLMFCDQDMRP